MIKVVDPIENKVRSNNVLEFQIPKSNKTAGAEKIYEREGYIILKVKRGYIVYNTKKNFLFLLKLHPCKNSFYFEIQKEL